MGNGPLAIDVEAAAIEVLALVLNVRAFPGAAGQFFPQPGRLVGLDRRAADLVRKQTRDRQGVVADQLGRQAEPWPACQQAVLGVALRSARQLARDD